MFKAEDFIRRLQNHGVSFFTGVPCSLLKPFCACLCNGRNKIDHLIAANEGGAIGIAVGHYLATGCVPLVYLQNSGLGNAINPLLSLADRQVNAIPLLLLIGWRGEPGHHDEPQHLTQGRVMLPMMKAMKLPYAILTGNMKTDWPLIRKSIDWTRKNHAPLALVAPKGIFEPYPTNIPVPRTSALISRETAIRCIVDTLDARDIIVCTTGMASRELFEYRTQRQQGHTQDFLTVGAMGHASQIALGIARQSPKRRVFCLDGDGAAIMHLGGMAILGVHGTGNLHHVVLNNGIHDSVGGPPTIGLKIDFTGFARSARYRLIQSAHDTDGITDSIRALKRRHGPSFLEIRVRPGHRKDLGRPTLKPAENTKTIMRALS